MTARQFLLSESTRCRQRAAGCSDPFLAQELLRLAEWLECTAETAQAAEAHTLQSQGSH